MANPAPSLHSLFGLSFSIKIVDVGANPIAGAPPPYAPLMTGGHAEVIGFEPNPHALAELNRRKSPRETYLPHAVGDGRRHTLRLCATSGMTSLLEPNPAMLNLLHGFSEWGRVVDTTELDTVRLDDVPETSGADFLKIDIQGGELMVFENAVERLRGITVIHTEVEFVPMYVGQPLFSDIDRFLRQHGFVLHKFDPLVSRVIKPLMWNNDPRAGLSQLVWADAVFIRDFVDLAHLDTDRLLRLAVILHECYRSYDMVAHLLMEHDRRTGQGLGARYVQLASGAK